MVILCDTSTESANRIWIQTINAFKAIPQRYITWEFPASWFDWLTILYEMGPCKWPHWTISKNSIDPLLATSVFTLSPTTMEIGPVDIWHVGGWRQVISPSGIRCPLQLELCWSLNVFYPSPSTTNVVKTKTQIWYVASRELRHMNCISDDWCGRVENNLDFRTFSDGDLSRGCW